MTFDQNNQSEIRNPKSEIGKVAFVFPGQGSQAVGMGKDLYDSFSVARQTFEEANDALGFKLSEMCFEGSNEDLALTENTQPAILTVSVAAWRAMINLGIPQSDYVAGHSLGEYSALVAAGALEFSNAIEIVRKRGRFMQHAVPVGVGAMAAILGADLETIEAACAEAAENQVCSAANINTPSQTVIAGNTEAVDRAIEILKKQGAKRAIKLNVSAPFHCALMQPAQELLANELYSRSGDFNDLQSPCVTNVEAKSNTDGERAKELLIKQVTAPVRWTQTIEFLQTNGVDTFVEVGTGKVLSGLIKQTMREARTIGIEDLTTLRLATEALGLH